MKIKDFDFSKDGHVGKERQSPKTLFALLSEGRTIGKKISISSPTTFSTVPLRTGTRDMLQVGTDDNAAQQLCITIIPPEVIPAFQFPGSVVPGNNAAASQNASGTRDNFSIYDFPNAGSDFIWAPLAVLVEWGIGGIQAKVECDVLNGLVLNLSASWVRVSAFTDTILSGFTDLTGGIYTVGAYVGPGFAKANNAQRTVAVGLVRNSAAGTTPRFPALPLIDPNLGPLFGLANLHPIPYMAKQATVCALTSVAFPIALNTTDVNITFFRGVRAASPMGSYRFTNDIHDPVKVPNGANYFTLQNNSAVNDITDSSVIFDLAV